MEFKEMAESKFIGMEPCLRELVRIGCDKLFIAKSELIKAARYAYYTENSDRPFLLNSKFQNIGRSIDPDLSKTKTILSHQIKIVRK